jgi:hypothetical protein
VSPQPTADCQSPGGLPPWDGTWLQADLCEGQQRRKLQKMNRWFAKNIQRKTKFLFSLAFDGVGALTFIPEHICTSSSDSPIQKCSILLALHEHSFPVTFPKDKLSPHMDQSFLRPKLHHKLLGDPCGVANAFAPLPRSCTASGRSTVKPRHKVCE